MARARGESRCLVLLHFRSSPICWNVTGSRFGTGACEDGAAVRRGISTRRIRIESASSSKIDLAIVAEAEPLKSIEERSRQSKTNRVILSLFVEPRGPHARGRQPATTGLSDPLAVEEGRR